MNTFKQLVREFWIPFILAVLWTSFSLYTTAQDRNFASVIKVFGPTFFLISWATGQFVRVSRQARTEKGLANVESRIIGLTENLEVASKHLVSTITGGDSFAYLSMTNVTSNTFSPFVVQSGDYPLSNVVARISDLNTFQANLAAGKPFASDLHVNIGDIAPGVACHSGVNMQAVNPQHDWNVFFSARNGFWTQLIRGRIVNSEWKFANIVMRQEGAESETLLVSVPDGFPKIGDPKFDDANRDPPVAHQI